jgi:CRP-like cAMP-binding protein
VTGTAQTLRGQARSLPSALPENRPIADRGDFAWLVAQFSRRGALSAQGVAALGDVQFTLRRYEAGQYILREGDRPAYCSMLRSGLVYRHKIVGDGGRQIVSVHIPGDHIDVQTILLAQADHNIQALTGATLLTAPIEQLIAAAMEHPTLAKALWRESLVEASIMREWIANIGRRDAQTRTAHLLCELAVRREMAGLGLRDTFDLSMTQEQLGDALGLTSVHVNRTLKSLEADGLILRNRRSVTISDWCGLERAGDFTSTYLHLDQ